MILTSAHSSKLCNINYVQLLPTFLIWLSYSVKACLFVLKKFSEMGYQAYSKFCPIDSFQYDKFKGFFCSSLRYFCFISSITTHFSSMVDMESPYCIHVHHISFFITIEPSSSVSIHLSCAMNIWKFIFGTVPR